MPMAESEIVIPAPPQRVYSLAKEIERLADFLPDVEKISVRERDGSRVVSDWVGIVKEFRRRLKWTEEDEWDDAGRKCVFRALDGDWDTYQGEWTFQPDPAGTRVQLKLEWEFNVPLIGPLIRGLLARLVQENCQRTLEGLSQMVANDRVFPVGDQVNPGASPKGFPEPAEE